jgi:hypothetical protein
VIREEQCTNNELSGTFLFNKCTYHNDNSECVSLCETLTSKDECDHRSSDCTWIFNNDDVNDDSGKCYSKNSTHTCNEINRMEQCLQGGGISGLINDVCGIYDGVCTTKCNKLETDECTNNGRDNDCFLLLGENSNPDTCIDKVCFFFFFFFFFFLLIIILCICLCLFL